MAKLPYMQFYPADYQADVRCLSMATQGAWMQILCVLWRSPKRGQRTLTMEEWGRELGCSTSELSLYLTDLEHHKVGKISRELHENVEQVTIKSLRIMRDKMKQSLALKRKQKQRDIEMSRACHAPVTRESQRSHAEESEIRSQNQKSESYSDEEKKERKTPLPPKGELVVLDEFELFWKAYPKRVGKKAALKAWAKAKDKPCLVDILEAIENASKTEQWVKENGQYIPNPSTWLNEGRWADDFKRPMNGMAACIPTAKIPPFPGPEDPIGRGLWRKSYGHLAIK